MTTAQLVLGLVAVEAFVLVGSRIDAEVNRLPWFLRWAWWHLAPMVWAWIGTAHGLGHGLATLAEHNARRGVERWRHAQGLAWVIERQPS